jgi:predicted DNA repair protein MutK
VLSLISILMTVGVYGLVGGIVKLDDLGLWMSRKGSALGRSVGALLLAAAPWLLKALSVIGTIAMFLVEEASSCTEFRVGWSSSTRCCTACWQSP